MTIPYEPMAPPPNMLQRLRLVDTGVWLLLYSVFMMCSDFSLFHRTLYSWFAMHPYVMPDYVRVGFVLASALIVLAAWREEWMPLMVAKGYVALLALFSMTFLPYALFGSLFIGNFNQDIRLLLNHNASVPISTLQNAGYTVYFELETIQVTAAFALHFFLIHEAMKTLRKAPKTCDIQHRLQKLDVRVWFAVFAAASWADDTQLAESILKHGLRDAQVLYLVAMLFSVFVCYTAYTNKMWALRMVKWCSLIAIGYLSITITVLLAPMYMISAEFVTWKNVVSFFISFFHLHKMLFMLVAWTAQWWLVKKVMAKVAEEKKVNMEMADIV